MLIVSCRQAFPKADLCGAGNAAAGLSLCKEVQPDVVILDLALPDREGTEIVDELFAACPSCRIIALSGSTNEVILRRALHSRVNGFIDKNEQPLELLGQAIRTVMEGKSYFSPHVQRLRAEFRKDPVSFDKLFSDWEQELLILFGQGLSNAQVAQQVGLSRFTIRNHRHRIMARLGLHSAPELVRYCAEKGFVRSAS